MCFDESVLIDRVYRGRAANWFNGKSPAWPCSIYRAVTTGQSKLAAALPLVEEARVSVVEVEAQLSQVGGPDVVLVFVCLFVCSLVCFLCSW